MSDSTLRRYAALSIAAAVTTIGMKSAAYLLTGSAGLFADALESVVNLIAALTAYATLWYASRPADRSHAYGHEKIEFFSSGLEGVLVCVAGLGTAWYAASHFLHPHPLEQLGIGTAVAVAASAVNLAVALLLLRAGRRYNSVVLEADGHHLMTDVWTSAAVVAGLGLYALTGILQLDAAIAFAVGLHIVYVGFRLVRRSFDGLMDHSLPFAEQEHLRDAIRAALPAGADFHRLRSRQAGRRKFLDFDLLVDGGMSVRDAHAISHTVADRLRAESPGLEVTVHIEPIDERESWEVEELEQLGEPLESAVTFPKPPIDD